MAEIRFCGSDGSNGTEDTGPLLPPPKVRGDADLDITPMIDITFLLLIYFLVAAIPDRNAALDLPEAQYGTGVPRTESAILTVGLGGLAGAPVFLGDGKDPSRQLPSDFRAQRDRIEAFVRQKQKEGAPHVLIKADKGVPHGDVARVAAAASRVKGTQIHFAVQEVH